MIRSKAIMLSAALLAAAAAAAVGGEVYVGANKPLNTIAKGVAQARPGDEIVIEAGLYSDCISLGKELSFRSASGKNDVVWEGASDAAAGQASAIQLTAGVGGTFQFENIQFRNIAEHVVSIPEQSRMPNIKLVFEQCIIEECGGIVQRAGTVILEECQVKNGGTGIAKCRSVQVTASRISDTETVIDACVAVVLDKSPLDKCGRILNAVDKAVVKNLAITNARSIIFTDIKELTADNLKIENCRNLGQGISGRMSNIAVRDCEMGVNAGGRLVLNKVTFNNVKGTAITGKGSTIVLQTVEIAFAGTAIADVFDLQASGLTLKVCRNGLLGIDKAVISDSKIIQTENTVFDTIAQLSLDTVEITEGDTLARRCTVSFDDVKVSAFASSFVENPGDMRMSDSSITGISGPAIDANGFKVSLKDVTLASCPAGIINSPYIQAVNLVVENCTGGLIPPASEGTPKDQ